jgi:hypothetical protein
MSKESKRRRGVARHPGTAAARRPRGKGGQADELSELAILAREIAKSAADLGSALDAELWASELLGIFWRDRNELLTVEDAKLDPALEYSESLLLALTRIEAPGAAIATVALAKLGSGELSTRTEELLAKARQRARLPTWAADIGEAKISGGAVMRDPVYDDACTVFLESRYPDGAQLTVGVLIDNNLGRMAKDILLAGSINEVAEVVRGHPENGHGEIMFERIEPGVAAGLIGAAIGVTDLTGNPPVADDYWAGRALTLLRANQTPGIVEPATDPELSAAERKRLRDEFLSSLEGAGLAADSNAAWVPELAIDFAADYYYGSDSLRWSPSTVELFMCDWVPRTVTSTPALLQALPSALIAWVRFAARKRGIPEWAVTETSAAVRAFTDEMMELASDPKLARPASPELAAASTGDASVLDPAEAVLQLKISLRGISKPPVWRRLQVPADTRLDELHQIIQIAFGWEDYHLHIFETEGEWFGPADPELELDCQDERQFTLADLVAATDERIVYTYDFGDNWRHDIRIEKLLEREADTAYPVLVTAKGACPPEDCGGVWSYQDLKAVLADPLLEPERHAELREWLGLQADASFDPAAVDAAAIRARLPKWRA